MPDYVCVLSWGQSFLTSVAVCHLFLIPLLRLEMAFDLALVILKILPWTFVLILMWAALGFWPYYCEE